MEKNTIVVQVTANDSAICNLESLIIDISYAMSNDDPIDIYIEGLDIKATGLYRHLEYCADKFGYDLARISITSENLFETHSSIAVSYIPPIHFARRIIEKTSNSTLIKNDLIKHFGMFVGRSNAPRLLLATYLNKCNDKTVRSFHYDLHNVYHRPHIGLEEITKSFNISDISNEAKFLSLCPISLDDQEMRYPMTGVGYNHDLISYYKDFFVEIVCETFYTGDTFFPTEKTWRPIAMKTPFIIQGPEWYLRNLQRLGFKTFGNFWDEGYSEDPPSHAILEIKKVIDTISNLSIAELNAMYRDMQPILEHNYNTLLNLKAEDFLVL